MYKSSSIRLKSVEALNGSEVRLQMGGDLSELK